MAALTQVMIRKDYQLEDRWTYAEAGHYAGGRSADTIRRWLKEVVEVTVDGQPPFKQHKFCKGRHVGAERVDAQSFRKWLDTGEPQGEKA